MSKEQESTEGTCSKDEEKTKGKYTTRQNTMGGLRTLSVDRTALLSFHCFFFSSFLSR